MVQQVILERDAELAALAAAVAAAEAGHGSLVLVEGPAGIGKTTLLRAACLSSPPAGWRWSRASATASSASCSTRSAARTG
jgi:ABC-type transport system involved in cytochrome c biogenesis ATPase subunit